MGYPVYLSSSLSLHFSCPPHKVGGEREQLLSMRGDHTAFLKHRKGFCKLALKFGAPVVRLA